MREFEHILVRQKLCNLLENDYVALLSQRGSAIDAIIKALLINKEFPVAGMRFVSIALSRLREGAFMRGEFEEEFLKGLLRAANRIPPETTLSEKITQELQEISTSSAYFRIKRTLDIIGEETSAKYIVVILHELANIDDEPLKNLLLMLRSYHVQRGNQGEPGERLRFLVAGDVRLWHLCYHRTLEQSPFNIAKRLFVGGLSHKELQTIDTYNSLDMAIILRNLTDGVPLLVGEAMKTWEDSDDLFPYFSYLQDSWNALPPKSQELLKKLVKGSEHFPPICRVDYLCPQIPVVKPPWLEAFWEGFLRIRCRQLTWRSPIHRAFVMEECIEGRDDLSRSTVITVDLRERTERLNEVVNDANYIRCEEEALEEAQSLACQTDCVELVVVLELAQIGEKSETLVNMLEQLAINSEKGWLRELGKETKENNTEIHLLMIKSVIKRARCFLESADISVPQNIRRIFKSKKDFDMNNLRQYSDSQAQLPEADVLLVTVAEVEAMAILSLFPKSESCHIGDQTYHAFGIIGGARIFMVQSEVGPDGQSGAMLTIQEGIATLHPSAVIMVGIAFGMNEKKQQIGDILVSKQIMGYDLQRIGTGEDGKRAIIPRGDRSSASPRMLSRFRAAVNFWERPPDVEFGLVLSGAKLVDNQDFRNELLKLEVEAIGGEMEGEGLYAAAQSKKVDWILVKAICDWGNGHKKQDESQRQKDAAENAARFTKYVLEKGGFDSPMHQGSQPIVTHNQSHLYQHSQAELVSRHIKQENTGEAGNQFSILLQYKIETKNFDVFLSYNSVDRAAVKKIGEDLKKYGILPWLDEWELRPGLPWQRALEQQIRTIKSAAVFIGKAGMGQWHLSEMDAFLRQFKKRNCPVIPVLLPDAPLKPDDFPLFLEEMSWVDFREQELDPLKELMWGITGKHE